MAHEQVEEAVYYSKPGIYKTKKALKYILVYLLLAIVGITVLLPFYIMILSSVKSTVQMESTTFIWLVNFKEGIYNAFHDYSWAEIVKILNGTFGGEIQGNYWRAYTQIEYWQSVRNTVFVALISTSGTIITTVLAAFAFARLSFKGRDLLFTLFLTTMMVPGEMFILTNYTTVGHLGWTGTGATYMQNICALTIPFMTSIFYTYYLRQTFKTIPNELYYAAKVDGTSDLKYLLKVMIPIASGTIISITILNAMSSWNAYIWPNLVADSPGRQLITAALRNASFFIGNGTKPDYAAQMAAAVIVTLPLLIVFFALKKHIMRGVSRSGIKG